MRNSARTREKNNSERMEDYFFRRLRFSFFMRLRCHFQRICPFFFHRRELRFI
jgi:hypothetical protein